jgi:hypothetical protein
LSAHTVGGNLMRDELAYTSATFRCLDLDVVVHTMDRDYAAAVDTVFAACETAPENSAAVHYAMRADDTSGSLVLTCDGEPLTATEWPCVALDYLVWDVNRRVVEQSGRRQMLLHAGAVARNGVAVVVPAVSGGGKSTLVAALVDAGFDYLTDEIVVIGEGPAPVGGYRKAIALKEGSWPLLSVPAPPDALAPFMLMTRYVTPAMLGAAATVEPGLVVIPERDATFDGALELHRAEALTVLVEQSFNFEDFGPNRLELLAGFVRRAGSYRVNTASLDDAVATISALVARIVDQP